MVRTLKTSSRVARLVAGLAIGGAVLGACRLRVEQSWFGRCYEVPADTLPLAPVSVGSTGVPGELRVRAVGRGSTPPYTVALARADSGGPTRRVQADSVAIFRDLSPGAYRVEVQALFHSLRSVHVSLGPDSGRAVLVPLRYGGVGACEDGIEIKRRPWWKFW